MNDIRLPSDADIERAVEEARLRDWIRGCLRKVRYASERRAETVATAVLRKRKVEVRAYYCGHCDGWHLTKQRRRDTQ